MAEPLTTQLTPLTGELTYTVISAVGGRGALGGIFQIFEAVDPAMPFMARANASRIGAYFKHYLHIRNTGNSRVTAPVTVALAEPMTWVPAAQREEALLA
jgi:hypothetical protein